MNKTILFEGFDTPQKVYLETLAAQQYGFTVCQSVCHALSFVVVGGEPSLRTVATAQKAGASVLDLSGFHAMLEPLQQ